MFIKYASFGHIRSGWEKCQGTPLPKGVLSIRYPATEMPLSANDE